MKVGNSCRQYCIIFPLQSAYHVLMTPCFSLHRTDDFQYVEEGKASKLPPVVLLHGMLGGVNNWTHTVEALSNRRYRVLVPVLPVYDLPLSHTGVSGLVAYLRRFVKTVGLSPAVLVGNSLGGQVALLYAIKYPAQVVAMVLSGASGIRELSLGTSLPRRHDRDFIRDRALLSFHDPSHVTSELVDEVYRVVTDRGRMIRLIKMARAIKQETVTEQLGSIKTPTLLIWGRDDGITPPSVAEEFCRRLLNAELHFLSRCGHAPMMERPSEFNRLTLDFLPHFAC